MRDVLHCPGCDRLLRLDESSRDGAVQCPSCGEVFDLNAVAARLASPVSRAASSDHYAAQPLSARQGARRADNDDSREASGVAYAELRPPLPDVLPGGPLAGTTCILFMGTILLDVVLLAYYSSELGMRDQVPFMDVDEVDAHTNTGQMIQLFAVVHPAVLIVVFCMWVYRARANLDLFGLRDLRFTPGTAVVCWFVPFLNLVMPLLVVQELWRGSSPATAPENPVAWKREPPSLTIGLWWVVWLGHLIVNIGSMMHRDHLGFPNLIDLERGFLWVAIGIALSILAAFLATIVVADIHAREKRKFKQLQGVSGM